MVVGPAIERPAELVWVAQPGASRSVPRALAVYIRVTSGDEPHCNGEKFVAKLRVEAFAIAVFPRARDYFVESRRDREIVDAVKNRNPTILIGSRGVGKSFLLRVTQKELNENIKNEKAFPVYMSFVRSSLLQLNDPEQFKHWMLARICSTVVRALMKAGMLGTIPSSARLMAGTDSINDAGPTKIETIAAMYENSWRNPEVKVDSSDIPTVDALKDALEDLAVAVISFRIADR